MQYTLENVPEELDQALRQRAAAEHKSLEAAILDALARGLGVESQKPVKRRDLSGIAGRGLIDAEMKAVFEEQRRIDPDLWK
jgi:plasmid stability protein